MPNFIVGSLLIGIIVISGWLIVFYNRMINIRIKVDECRVQIIEQVKKRNDLIENNTVIINNYFSHETQNLKQFVQKTSDTSFYEYSEEILKTASEINRLLIRMFDECAQNPEIQVREEILKLQYKLRTIEENLEASHLRYDQSVLEFNKLVSTFPNSIAGMILGVKKLSCSYINKKDIVCATMNDISKLIH